MKRIITFLPLLGFFLTLHSGQVPIFDAWVEHRGQPAPLVHEHPMVDQDLSGFAKTASTKPDLPPFSTKPVSAAEKPPVLPEKSTEEEPSFAISIETTNLVAPSPDDKVEWRKYTYRRLAGQKGEFHDATDRKLPEVIPGIFDQDVPSNSDVIIVLDHTSSMGDDIESMREMLADLKEKLKQKPGVRIGAVTFSDLKNRPKIGYRALPFGKDLDALDQFLYETPLIGSIEDMYGAIAKAIREFNWRPTANRRLIVISDEDPAIFPDSNTSIDEVEDLCKSTRPETILHTILLRKD